jgi:hypothetical protein
MKYLVMTAGGTWGKSNTLLGACQVANIRSKYEYVAIYISPFGLADLSCDTYGNVIYTLTDKKYKGTRPIVDIIGYARIVKGQVEVRVDEDI